MGEVGRKWCWVGGDFLGDGVRNLFVSFFLCIFANDSDRKEIDQGCCK